MALVVQDDLEHKARVEHDFARPALDRALDTWLRAPNSEKPDLLLTGQLLSWGESWLLTHPGEVSANQKNFILRSLTAQSRKGSVEREVFQKRQLRRENKYLWVIMACATFALIPQIHEFQKDVKRELKREIQEHVMDGQPPSSIRAVVRAIVRKAKNGGNATEPARKSDPERADDEMATKGDADNADEAARDDDTPTRSEIMANNQPGQMKTLERPELAELSRNLAHQGDHRRALLVALEFFNDRTTRTSQSADERRRLVDAMSTAYATAAARVAILGNDETFSDGVAPIFCSDGRRLVTSTTSKGWNIWQRDQAGPAKTRALVAPDGHDIAALDRGCNRMVTLSEDHDAEILTTAPRRSVAKLSGHVNAITSASFSADGERMVTLARDSTAKLWDARTGRGIADVRSDDAIFIGASLNPDGSMLATWSGDRIAQLWNALSGKLITALRGHVGFVRSAVFSHDGRLIATTSNDGMVRIWDGVTGEAKSILRIDGISFDAVRFSADGSRIATLNQDTNVNVWDTRSGRHLADLKEKGREVRAFSFSPDGTLITTVDWEGIAALWRAGTGEKIAELSNPGEPLTALAFAPDGDTLSAVSAAGSLLQWPVLPTEEAAVQHVSSVVAGCLTREERLSLRLRPELPRWCPTPETAPSQP